MPRFDYDIFLSFASLNEGLARPLYERLTGSGLRVFWSDEALKKRVGQGWYKEIEHALDSSKHLVLLWTPEAKASKFVELEYTSFHAEAIQEEDRLLVPVLTNGSGPKTLPRFLRQLQTYSLDDELKGFITSLGGHFEPLAIENARLREELSKAQEEISLLKQTNGAEKKADLPKLQVELADLMQQYVELENRSLKESKELVRIASGRKRLEVEIAVKEAELIACKERIFFLEAELKGTRKPGRVSLPIVKGPAKTFKDDYGIEFVLIEPGSFMMGADYISDWEKPVHKVEIIQPFYLGRYPVMQAQWKTVLDGNPSQFKGDTHPVEEVSWHDVQEFLEKINKKSGGPYRLPGEAQWEYACRAGTTTAYSFGDNKERLEQYAWYDKISKGTTHPVGEKKPNPWGLYDMHGNLWEWVQDWYGGYENGVVIDPTGPDKGSNRVFRGGGWNNYAGDLRSGIRDSIGPGNAYGSLGFRLLWTLS